MCNTLLSVTLHHYYNYLKIDLLSHKLKIISIHTYFSSLASCLSRSIPNYPNLTFFFYYYFINYRCIKGNS
uniref:Uncharacterized protein n=1 Tax=Physcomitrium patens TaxID=3218 RepID=A0A2K1IX29_PHYPA|nr:hypothetical protein PHYPA_023652 [Physcomitrium patens]